MALEKGLEANRRNPQVDILPGLNLHRLREINTDLNCAMELGDYSSRATMTEGTVTIQHARSLEKAIRQEMPPSGIEEESRQRLVRTEEYFEGDVRNVTEQINVVMITRILSLGSKYYYQASMCMASL